MPLDEIAGCVENRLLLVLRHQKVESLAALVRPVRRRWRSPSSVYVCATGVFQHRLIRSLGESSAHH